MYFKKREVRGIAELNLRQKKFVDEYIITGNATQSAINAGYSEKTANAQGNRLLAKVSISQAIAERTEKLFESKAMTVQEALALSASIARGEPQKSYFKETDKLNDEVTKESERYYTPSIEDRQRSIDHILKVNGAYLERAEVDVTQQITFAEDVPEDD